jgi:threonine/homoserine/homoserine lactone efflux protein
MNILEIVVLFAVMVMLALVPSTSVALVVARSSTAGFLNGAAVSVGIVLGDLVFVFLAILFYASLFPAFVDLTTLNTSDVIVISLLTVLAVGGVKLCYAYSASKIVSLPSVLKLQQKAYRTVKVAAGGVMVGAGVYLIMKT